MATSTDLCIGPAPPPLAASDPTAIAALPSLSLYELEKGLQALLDGAETVDGSQREEFAAEPDSAIKTRLRA